MMWVEAGIGELPLDTLIKEPVEGSCIRDIKVIIFARSPSEETNYMSSGVNDDGTRIAWGGEGAVLVAVWVDSQLHRCLVITVWEVFPNKRHHAGATNGHTSASTILDHEVTWF